MTDWSINAMCWYHSFIYSPIWGNDKGDIKWFKLSSYVTVATWKGMLWNKMNQVTWEMS